MIVNLQISSKGAIIILSLLSFAFAEEDGRPYEQFDGADELIEPVESQFPGMMGMGMGGGMGGPMGGMGMGMGGPMGMGMGGGMMGMGGMPMNGGSCSCGAQPICQPCMPW